MSPLEYLVWGAVGGGCVEANQLYSAIHRTGTWPWKKDGEPRFGPFFCSIILRVGVGLAIALAAGLSGQISGPVGAIAVGVAAPLVVQEMAKRANPIEVNKSGNFPPAGGVQ